MQQRKNRTHKFRKNRKQYGGMKEVKMADLEPGTLYYVQSSYPLLFKKHQKQTKNKPYTPQEFKHLKQKAIFIRHIGDPRVGNAEFEIVKSISAPPNKPKEGKVWYNGVEHIFYLPENDMIKSRVNERQINEFLHTLVDESFLYPGESYFIPHTKKDTKSSSRRTSSRRSSPRTSHRASRRTSPTSPPPLG
jgi:hypothetical protein